MSARQAPRCTLYWNTPKLVYSIFGYLLHGEGDDSFGQILVDDWSPTIFGSNRRRPASFGLSDIVASHDSRHIRGPHFLHDEHSAEHVNRPGSTHDPTQDHNPRRFGTSRSCGVFVSKGACRPAI